MKVDVKIYAAASGAITPERFVPVFHSWIRDHKLPDLLIDVADYGHVHRGPGVVLIGHAADYSLDLSEGRPGLRFSRKHRGPEAILELFSDAFRRALNACRLLEAEETLAPLTFRTNEMLFCILDRLRAKNTPTTFEQFEETLHLIAERLFAGASHTLAQEGDDREPFTVRLRAEVGGRAAELLEHVGGIPS